MNDQQLLELLHEKSPQELSLEQIELLRDRLADSPDLRKALSQQLEMESYLSEALGRINVSAESIVREARGRGAEFGPHPLLLFVGVVACLAVIGFIGTVLYVSLSTPRQAEIAAAKPAPDATQPEDEAVAEQSEKAENPPATSGTQEGTPTVPPPAGEAEAAVEAASQAGEEGANTTPTELQPKVETGPWTAQLEAAPVSFADAWPQTFDLTKTIPTVDDVQEWFAPVTGQELKFAAQNHHQYRPGAFEGLAKLKAPWPEDAALCLSLVKSWRYSFHFFHENVGVTFFCWEENGYDQWVAYATTRESGAPFPKTFALANTDDAREGMSETRFGPTLIFRWQDGDLVATRGDIELLRAALPGPPQEIYADGRMAFMGIKMLRLKDAPGRQAESAVATTISPSELSWEGEIPEGATLEKSAQNGVKLTADKLNTLTWASAALPRQGPQFIEAELTGVTPGTAIFLAHPANRWEGQSPTQKAGQPNDEVVSFVTAQDKEKRTCVLLDGFNDRRRAAPLPAVNARGQFCIPDDGHVWVRMLVGVGGVRVWISPNGRDWGRVFHGAANRLGQFTHLGLMCAIDAPNAEITLKKIQLRNLDAIHKLVPSELLAQAKSFSWANDYGDWLTQVAACQPPDIEADAWRRACALATLGLGCRHAVGQALCDRLLEDSIARNASVDERLALLGEITLLADFYTHLPDQSQLNLPGRYWRLGIEGSQNGEQRPFTRIRRHLMTDVPHRRQNFKAFDSTLIRREILNLAYAGKWDELHQFTRELRFFASDAQLQQDAPLALWAEMQAARSGGAISPHAAGRHRQDWRHPLVEEFNKESYNVMAEFNAALEGESYDDASRIIAALDPLAAQGLLPAGGDADLLVSVPTAISWAMENVPDLKRRMREQFGPLANLRVKQAIVSGDDAAMKLATVQFNGTEAANEAHLWLGDRALAGGDFLQALAHFRKVQAAAGPVLVQKLLPRIRLAGAMLGQDIEAPVTTAVELGQLKVTAEEFEKLVAELRLQNASTGAALAIGDSVSTPSKTAPAPTGFVAQQRARFDGEAGDAVNEIPGNLREFSVPWFTRQLGISVVEDVLYASNRFQVAAYDLNSGNRKWQSVVAGGPRARSHDWSLISMCPVPWGERVYLRQLTGEGPMLACLNRIDGKSIWTTSPGREETFISDPVVAQGALFVFTLLRIGQADDLLRLTSFDLDSGELIDNHDLLLLRDVWRQRKVCEFCRTEDGLIASLGGAVIFTDFQGNVRWARKQLLLPPNEERSWVTQRYDAPLVYEGTAIVSSPGVRAVECVDIESGRLQWRATLADLERLVGIVDDKLIVANGGQLVALSAANGNLLWRTGIENMLDAELVGGKGGLLVASQAKQRTNPNQNCVQLNWLNLESGDAAATCQLESLNDNAPQFGPLVSHGARVWAFAGKSFEDPHRDLVELVPEGKPSVPVGADSMGDVAVSPWLQPTLLLQKPGVAAQLAPWQVWAAPSSRKAELRPEGHGEKDVVWTGAEGSSRVVLVRPIEVPSSAAPRLEIRVGNDPNQDWKLEVSLGDKILLDKELKWQEDPRVWKDISVDLKPVAGQKGWIMVKAKHVSGGDHLQLYWKRLNVGF